MGLGVEQAATVTTEASKAYKDVKADTRLAKSKDPNDEALAEEAGKKAATLVSRALSYGFKERKITIRVSVLQAWLLARAWFPITIWA